MSYAEMFRITPGTDVKLDEVDAGFKDKHESHEHALPEIEADVRKLRDLQYLMYAESRRSLLICLQGRDAAGKDGTIRNVFGPMNPQGTRVTSFKVPSKEELAHEYLEGSRIEKECCSSARPRRRPGWCGPRVGVIPIRDRATHGW